MAIGEKDYMISGSSSHEEEEEKDHLNLLKYVSVFCFYNMIVLSVRCPFMTGLCNRHMSKVLLI